MLKKSLCMLGCSVLLSASTTMCFKKEHSDPSTIENIALDGGKCAGKNSISDMKKAGWSVEDIKISVGDEGMNFIYVLKNNSTMVDASLVQTGTALTKENLKAQLQELQAEQKVEKEKEEKIVSLADGKKLYESTCKRCHGDGTIRAYNAARPLVELDEEDINLAISEYKLDIRSGNMSLLMKPYANLMGTKDIENVSAYIQTLK